MASSITQEILQNIELNFIAVLNSFALDLNKIRSKSGIVRKKTRDLKSGDIIIPAGCVQLDNDNPLQVAEIRETLISMLAFDKNCIQNAKFDEFSFLAIYLDRSKIFKTVFSEVGCQGSAYGFQTPSGRNILLHAPNKLKGCSMFLSDLRLLVVQSHVIRLLEANGYTVLHKNKVEEMSRDLDITELLDSTDDSSPAATTEINIKPPSSSQFMDSLKQLSLDPDESKRLAIEPEDASVSTDDCQSNATDQHEESSKNLMLNLKRIIYDKDLRVGKDGYSKNINKVKIFEDGNPTPLLKDALTESEAITSLTHGQITCGCLHIVPQSQSYRQQQIRLIRLVLLDQSFSESQLVVGSVIQKGKTVPDSAQSFYRARYLQMKEASQMRYGPDIDASEIVRRVNLLTSTSIKVDLLGNDSHNELHLEVAESDRPAESRLGSFILYNTARVAALLNQFNEKVSKGFYPPLPPVDEVNFALLREEEDWELVFLFIAEFPTIVKQTVEVVFPKDGKYLAKIHTHKITKFLESFCKCLSAHYSRYHILSGNEEHLLPVMYARLYLMRSAHRVLLNCLHLLDIDALSQL
ncbi:DALR anticodon-binding domain-containing protein 3 [Biomphalaria glabrata]|nr:DALR anticodon-binding domain-containing protein 3 [Biomphalaria glabrata]